MTNATYNAKQLAKALDVSDDVRADMIQQAEDFYASEEWAEVEADLLAEGEYIEAPATFAGGKIYAPRSPERREQFTERFEDGTSQYRYCRDLDARATPKYHNLSEVPAGEFGDSIMDPDTLGFFRATVTEARMADRERGAICNGGQLDSRKRVRKTTRKNKTKAEKVAAIRERQAKAAEQLTPRFTDAESNAARAERAAEKRLDDYLNQ